MFYSVNHSVIARVMAMYAGVVFVV